jgi:putative ABC transport system ATP-binding protein
MSKNYILELKDVGKTYSHPSGQEIPALNSINLKVRKGSLITIEGPSGSGKSTLLKIMGMVEEPSQGSVIFKGKDIRDISSSKRSSVIRREIGFILKRNNLLSYLNVLENVMLPMIDSNSDYAREMLIKTGFSDFKSCPSELSPLDLQKVTLARAMINNPSIILTDEATGELNQKDTDEFMNLLSSQKNEFTIIMATDNPYLSKYADVTLEIKEGMLIH